MAEAELTDKQTLFIHWYCILLNATEAAKRAGYGDPENRVSLASLGSETLRNPQVRAEIDKRLKASIPSPEEVLQRVSQRAMLDVTPYLKEDLTLDVKALAQAGLGHLVKGVKPGREGTEIALVDPQTATKMLARYHGLLADRLDITLQRKPTPTEDDMTRLVDMLQSQATDGDASDTPDSSEGGE